MSHPWVAEVDPGLHLIDLDFQTVPGVIAAYLVADGDDLALIETGPTSTAETLLAGVRRAGFDPEQIAKILVTHIHLDHAGAAGWLLRRLPRAHLFVHPVGAPHLIDPSKLMASATRIYGDQMESLWGEMVAVPKDRLTGLADGDTVRVGKRVLRALDTPGHAWHHLVFHDTDANLVFTGDVAGVRLGGSPHLRPPTPPPDIDLDRWKESVARLRALHPRHLYLTHFGGYAEIDAHLDLVLSQLFSWAGWTEARLEVDPDTTRVAQALGVRGDAELAAADVPELAQAYQLATPYQMTVDGLARYFRKRSPARQASSPATPVAPRRPSPPPPAS